MSYIFISDLHLSENTLDLFDRLACLLAAIRGKAEALFVLGDLFDFWIGDDYNSPIITEIKKEFKSLAESGTKLYFMPGNRDFLVGQRFCQEAGFTLLKDPHVIEYQGHRAVLTHGDLLCTADVSYQHYRSWVHKPWLQRFFLSLPLFIRKKIALKIRSESKNAYKIKNEQTFDIDPQSVLTMLMAHDAQSMIHGHIHRPFHHQVKTPLLTYERIVLGDWRQDDSVILVWEGYKKVLNVIN